MIYANRALRPVELGHWLNVPMNTIRAYTIWVNRQTLRPIHVRGGK